MFRFLISVLIFCFFSNNSFSYGTGPALKYEIIMTKLELCTGYPNASDIDVTCTGSFVLGNTATTMDIASVSIGESVATFADTKGMPIGTTYTHLKATMSKDFVMKGYALSDANDDGDNTNAECWCRSESSSVFNNSFGKYLSRKSGICETSEQDAIDNQEEVTIHISAAANNIICQESACTTTGITDDLSGTSIEDDAVDQLVYGNAIDVGTDNSTTEMSIIYPLSTPFTVGFNAPKIQMAFGTNTGFMSAEYTGGKCITTPFYPKVKITISD
tara:strand:+ start:116 stop:937 length:822 start_codon:yes stop_codon:yes gene_type:complete